MAYVDKARQMREIDSPWQGDEYKEMFDKCMAVISTYWNDDLQEYMKKNLPDIVEQVNESEKNINKLWGNAPLQEFRTELIRFYKLHEKVRDEYK